MALTQLHDVPDKTRINPTHNQKRAPRRLCEASLGSPDVTRPPPLGHARADLRVLQTSIGLCAAAAASLRLGSAPRRSAEGMHDWRGRNCKQRLLVSRPGKTDQNQSSCLAFLTGLVMRVLPWYICPASALGLRLKPSDYPQAAPVPVTCGACYLWLRPDLWIERYHSLPPLLPQAVLSSGIGLPAVILCPIRADTSADGQCACNVRRRYFHDLQAHARKDEEDYAGYLAEARESG